MILFDTIILRDKSLCLTIRIKLCLIQLESIFVF